MAQSTQPGPGNELEVWEERGMNDAFLLNSGDNVESDLGEGAALPCKSHKLETALPGQLHMLVLSCWRLSPGTYNSAWHLGGARVTLGCSRLLGPCSVYSKSF